MATRMYLCNNSTLLPPGNVTPAFTGWQESASATRRLMIPNKQISIDGLTTVAIATTTPGNTTLHRQWVSMPLQAGVTWTSAVSTVSCQIQGLESAVNDNIINRVRRVAVYSRDGTTLRATLIALGNATSVVEWATTPTNLTFLNATAVGATYTTVSGDLLVLELGHDDATGASITGSLRSGTSGAGSDLPVDETNAVATNIPWFESSVNLIFEPTPIRRVYPQLLAH